MQKITLLSGIAAFILSFSSCKKECTEPQAYTQDADGNCTYRQTILTGNWTTIEYQDGGACGGGTISYPITIGPLNDYALMKITITNLGNLGIDATATLFNNDDENVNIVIDDQTKMANGNTYNIAGTGVINPQNTQIEIDYNILQQNGPGCVYDYSASWYRQ